MLYNLCTQQKEIMKKKKIKEIELMDDLGEIELELQKILVKPKKAEKTHYIDNKKFYAEIVKWKIMINEAREVDDPVPPVTEYIGICFMEIAQNLARKPNFMNYQFKDDMIGDGIENCLMYAHNFNPDKSSNPFSYFTQIIYYAFLRRIQKEKKQNLIKYKFLESQDKHGDITKYLRTMGINEDEEERYKNLTKEKVKKKRKSKNSFEDIMED